MVNRIFGALLGQRTSGLHDYYAGTLKSACQVCPKMDEARKDFRRMMHAQNPFTSV